MPDNVAASMTASIVLDKSDLLAQILKGLSEGQKELQNNKLEMYFDFSNSKNQAEFEKVIQKYRKQLSSQEFVVQIKDQGIDETVKSLDKLVEVVKSLASGKAFGTGLGNGKGIGNSIVDEKQLKTVINLFEKMESHLGSMRKVISDVGDGDEFSPLLAMINRVDSSISELAKKTSKLSLNMNLDFGSDDKITAEVQSRTAKLLHTYENLFNRLKMSGTLDSNMQGYFDNFDINQYDNMNAKIAAYKNFITEMREMSKQQFGKDYLYSDIEKSYYSAVSGAQRSLNNVIKSESTSNHSIENLFGKTDLSEVISQLTIIVNKLDEISTSANNFTNVFKNGLDVNTSIQEVIDLTNRVKELEIELAKIKNVTPATVSPASETNISSGSDSAIEQQIKQQDKLQDEIRETIALTNEYGEVIDVYRGTHGLIGNGNVSNRYHGGTFWTSNRKLATQSYADGNKVTHANLYMRNPYLVHGGGADWDQLTLSIKQGEELEKHLENVYASINDVFSKIQDTSGIEAGHLFDVFDGQLNFTDFENGIQKPIESLKDFQNIFESIDYDNSKIPQVQNYINQLYDLFTSYSRISQLSEKGVLNTNEVVEIAKALKYDGVVFNGIRDGSDDSSDIFVTFEEKQSKVIDMITAAQLRVEEEQQLANILVNTRENLYKTLKSLDSKQVDEFIDKSAFNFVTDGSYMENLGEVLGKADPTDSIDNIKNKIREYINEVVNEFENAQKQIADSTEPTKDAFPDKDVSASVESATNSIKEENNVLEQNTQKVKENTQAKEQNANVNFNKYDKRLDSYNDKIDKYKTTIDRFNDGGWTSNAYLENVQAVMNAVKKYEDLLNKLKGKDASLVTSEDINKLDSYEKKIKDTITTVTNMSASEKGYNFVSGQKELDKIHKLLAENSKMSSEAKAKIRAYYAQIESGNPSVSLDKIHGEILKIYNAEVEAGRAGRTLWDTLKNSGFHQIAAQMAGMVGVYDIINGLKQVASTIRELDTAYTEMRKVSDESTQSLKNFQKESFSTADSVGTTALAMQDATATWMRLGESLDDAKESAKDATVLLNVSEFDNIDEATDSLVAMSQAYKELDKMEIIDVLDKIGNEYSISTNELSTALKDSAAVLKTQGNDLAESVALITAGNAITQDASKTAGETLPERYRNIFYRTYLTARAA